MMKNPKAHQKPSQLLSRSLSGALFAAPIRSVPSDGGASQSTQILISLGRVVVVGTQHPVRNGQQVESSVMSPRWCYVLVAVVLVWPPPAVTAKSRNRVQKWQQRTWRSRFGAGPKSDWKFEGEGKSDHRKENLMAGARFGAGLSQDELDLLADRPVPNGYSNFHYRFDDLRRSHRRKTKHSNRVKRFAVDSDEEPVQFQDDLLENAPFVFGDNYPQDQQQGLSNDLVDLDFLRDEDEELGTADIDFMPMQPPAGHSQKLVTVDEDDPFPHASPKNNINRKNVTEKVQYTLIIHHGQHPPLVAELGDNGVAGQNLGTPLLVLLVVLVAASQRLVV